MIYPSSSRSITLSLLLILATLYSSHTKCVNSTQFKYELEELASVAGYHAVCSQHSGRTCCSRNNFQQLSRKIYKVLGSTELSLNCKRSLTNLLCMPCDGDVGEQLKQGVCLNYCQQLFNHCTQDYFSIDSNNQLKGCKEEDIICSKLSDITKGGGPESVCRLFEIETGRANCWNGEISAITKGKIKSKEKTQSRYTKSSHKNKRQHSKPEGSKRQQTKGAKKPKSEGKAEIKQDEGWISESIQTYLSLLVFLLLVFVGFWIKKMYRRWKKQSRNRR